MFADYLVAELEDARGGGGVEGGGVLVEEQELRLHEAGHEQGQGLALAAGEQAGAGGHAVLEAQVEAGELLAEAFALALADAPCEGAAAAAARGEGEVFLNRHRRRGAHHRVLEDAADVLGALELALAGYVHAVYAYRAAVYLKGARDGVEHRALARAVAAYDRDKVAVVEAEIKAPERGFGVYRAGVEGLGDVVKLEHCSYPPWKRRRACAPRRLCPSSRVSRGRARL